MNYKKEAGNFGLTCVLEEKKNAALDNLKKNLNQAVGRARDHILAVEALLGYLPISYCYEIGKGDGVTLYLVYLPKCEIEDKWYKKGLYFKRKTKRAGEEFYRVSYSQVYNAPGCDVLVAEKFLEIFVNSLIEDHSNAN